MKSPPIQYSDGEARDMVEAFIRGERPHAPENNGHKAGHVAGLSLDAEPAFRPRS
jgi:hypothetical protein